MYSERTEFQQPSDENQKVWRYMDFTKFMSLLEENSLYFTRADKFEDPFEGTYPRLNQLEQYPATRFGIPDDIVLPESTFIKIRDDFQVFLKNEASQNPQKYFAVNCWHLNNYESAAMWKLYLKSNEGIAIQSTYQKLRDCFVTEESICLGQVKYIDYENEWIEWVGNASERTVDNILPFGLCNFSTLVHKRKSFEHEREVRAVIWKYPSKNGVTDFSLETIAHGLHIPVNLKTLIENIYVAPDAPPWFEDLVKSVIKRYANNYTVIKSNLYQLT